MRCQKSLQELKCFEKSGLWPPILSSQYIYVFSLNFNSASKLCNDSIYETGLKHSGSDVVNLFARSTLLSIKLILIINVKMPTVVGILTFISRINATSGRFKAKIMILIFSAF